ncbi:MAG: type II secretion system F family protein [Steroidobacteraceae bacterium]
MLIASLFFAIAAIAAALVLGRSSVSAGKWCAGSIGLRTEADLAQLFVFIPASRLLGLTALVVTLTVGLSLLLRMPLPLLPVISIAALAAPRVLLIWLRQRRKRRLAHQLPDALALWSGLLRSGQGATQSLSHVAARQTSPLGDELRMVLAQLRLGTGMDVAFQGLRERAGLADLRLLATLLQANRELGGNLAESLHRLAELLRGRLLMEGRIQSLTAQGRMQGVVVGALPLFLLLVLYAMEGDTMRVLHTTIQGWAALGLIVVLELIGFVLIRRIVRIDV